MRKLILFLALIAFCSCSVRQSQSYQIKRVPKAEETKKDRAERITFTVMVALGIFLPAYGARIKF